MREREREKREREKCQKSSLAVHMLLRATLDQIQRSKHCSSAIVIRLANSKPSAFGHQTSHAGLSESLPFAMKSSTLLYLSYLFAFAN